MNKTQFFEQYEIHIQDGRLGGGAFGTVYKAYDHINSLWKAVKIAEVKYINGKEFSLISEFNAVKDLPPHRNIANYESVYQFHMSNGVFDYAIMQYYPEGNLRDLMRMTSLSENQKRDIASGIIKGVQFLHKNKIIHRDVKPSNILISRKDENYIPKIADFGLSKFVDTNEFTEITNSFGGGTLEYASPEQLQGKALRYNSDLWAVGVILYEIFMGKIPFAASTKSFTGNEAARRVELYKNINLAKVPEDLANCPFPYNQLISLCLIKDPNSRVQNAKELLEIITSAKPKENESTIITKPMVIIPPIKEDTDQTNLISDEEIEKIIAHRAAEKKRLLKLEEERIRKAAEAEQERQKKLEEERQNKLKEEQKSKLEEANRERLAKEKAKAEKERIEKERLEKENEEKRKKEEERQHQEEVANRKKLKEEKAKTEKERLEKERLARIEEEKKNQEALRIEKEKELKRQQQLAREKEALANKRAEEKEKRRIAALLRRKDRQLQWNRIKTKLRSTIKKSLRPVLFLILLFLLVAGADFTWKKYGEGPELFQKDNLYGYQNSNGEVVIDPVFKEATPFKWGMATVTTDSFVYKVDKYGQLISKSPIAENDQSPTPSGSKNEEILDNQSNDEIKNRDKQQITLGSDEQPENGLETTPKDKKQNPSNINSEPAIKKSANDLSPSGNNELKPTEKESINNSEVLPPEANKAKKEESTPNDLEQKDKGIESNNQQGFTSENKNPVEKKDISGNPEERPLTPQTANLDPNNKLEVESNEVSFELPPLVSEIEENILNVPGGNFKMGCNNNADDCQDDELPAHDVYVGPFYMSKYEVTQKEFEEVMGYNPSYIKCSNCPVETVSWYEAQKFIEKLNALPGSVYKYRLPTEAEWEFAAMGGNSFIYAGSNDIDKVAEYKSTNGVGVVPVTRTKRNGYGLYGMSGNVSEWCQDWYAEDAYQKKGAGAKKEKVIRGGSWYDRQRICRVKNRSSEFPEEQKPTIGFRLVRSVKSN